jgi:hypothetical protein
MTESDTAAAQRLYSILGLTEADIKSILAGDDATTKKLLEETRLRKQSDGKSMCEWIRCSQTEQVEVCQEWRTAPIKEASCNYAKVTRAQELADANMKPGRPIGSWTMPEPLVHRSASGRVYQPGRIIRPNRADNFVERQAQHPDMLLQLR